MRKLTLLLAIAAVLITVFAADSAFAQAVGNTNISVQLNPLAILYYRTDLTLTVSGTDLATALAGANPVGEPDNTPALTGTAGALDGDAAVVATPFNAAAIVTTLSNFYQVRSTRGFTVAVTLPTPTLTAAGSGTITLSAQQTRINAGTWGASASATPASLGTVNAGDVRFNMDVSAITNVTAATTYTGGVVRLTLTTP
ncbi:MAG: hypothetical protein A2Y78_15310 [Acidobacteria bacterium RBG_13_68_16]|nr:MAG: hypothetical protein A2Y78_15310 [Acidobacteria bacterium RBG_13_68_16]